MNHHHLPPMLFRLITVSCAISLSCVLFGIPLNLNVVNANNSPAITQLMTTWRVYINSPQEVTQLTTGTWDVLEARGHANGKDYLLVLGDEAVAAQLRALGFEVTVDHVEDMSLARAAQTFYGGYRTVVEHYQHLDDTVTLHPGLAITTTYGITWRRTQSAATGYDLKAICITKLQPGDCALHPGAAKPRFFLMAAIHARELTTSEMAWRWIDLLVDGYNVNPDITALLDTSEMWVVPVANPDGRAIVETTNLYQRKNANTAYCPGGVIGADLNRNAGFKWGVSGSSPYTCDEIYMGPSAASEPEESALETLMRNLFFDQRGSLDTDAAPITTTGAMLTLHSYSDLVLLPYGWTECYGSPCASNLRAPNDLALRAMAFHMSYFNGYFTGQASEALYAASGTTDDWAYGILGIPGFTFEMGPLYGGCNSFSPPYSCQDSLFWNLNWRAFLYEAKIARQPYSLGLGPTVSTAVAIVVTPAGNPAVITATISSNLLGNNGFDRPSPQPVAAAEYSIDTPPWISGAITYSMAALSGGFGTNSVSLSATIATTGLCAGQHLVYIHGRSTDGYWGPETALWLNIIPPNGDYYCATATPAISFQYGYPSTSRTYSVTLANKGNITDTYALDIHGNNWSTQLITDTLGPLPPLASVVLTLSVSIPPGTSGQSDYANVVFTSLGQPTNSVTTTVTTGSWYKLVLPQVYR